MYGGGSRLHSRNSFTAMSVCSHLFSSQTKMTQKENSSDLGGCGAGRPELKSDEFLFWVIVLTEIILYVCEVAGDNWCTYWRRDPGFDIARFLGPALHSRT